MRPDYYKFSIENTDYQVIDIIDEKELSYHLGTALAYILRAGKKDFSTYKQDLEKALTHLRFELKRLQKRNEFNAVILPHPLFTFDKLSNIFELSPQLSVICQRLFDYTFVSQETLFDICFCLDMFIKTLD